ncbi:hypothetical protein [[Mycobacterium] nativiensis]|uniref:Lipoprotein n=1 Tax=[Mycobacterium] nativiensis TaxID=2855503 RepID=A0ABU5Y620_9MYCO|nr:hypothetical protein [Mycolicibacter sp. MYC340]MEB3035151.1 hypothetical protein [Mycolicibacter sp. MYC340]
MSFRVVAGLVPVCMCMCWGWWGGPVNPGESGAGGGGFAARER